MRPTHEINTAIMLPTFDQKLFPEVPFPEAREVKTPKQLKELFGEDTAPSLGNPFLEKAALSRGSSEYDFNFCATPPRFELPEKGPDEKKRRASANVFEVFHFDNRDSASESSNEAPATGASFSPSGEDAPAWDKQDSFEFEFPSADSMRPPAEPVENGVLALCSSQSILSAGALLSLKSQYSQKRLMRGQINAAKRRKTLPKFFDESRVQDLLKKNKGDEQKIKSAYLIAARLVQGSLLL